MGKRIQHPGPLRLSGEPLTSRLASGWSHIETRTTPLSQAPKLCRYARPTDGSWRRNVNSVVFAGDAKIRG